MLRQLHEAGNPLRSERKFGEDRLNLPARFANAPRSAARSVSNGGIDSDLPEIAVPGATRALYCYAADGELKRVVDGSDKGLEYLGSLNLYS